MPDAVAYSAAPLWAIRVWADDNNIYAEVPSLNQPCVIAAPFTEGGLSKVLKVLGAQHIKESAGAQYLRPPVIAKKLMADGITQPDLDAARMALRELGIIK
jgi:hypothetical protein